MIKVRCSKCLPSEGIEIPDFTASDKTRLLAVKMNSGIHVVKSLIDDYKLSHRDAKYIAMHINRHGHCNRCKYSKLDQEYVNCPKCGALNLNWK